MTAPGLWTIGFAVVYTALLVVGGRLIQRRAAAGNKDSGFFVGGRSFSPWTVAFCITGLFSGSSYIAILELSYRTGISALWYGVAETVQILLIALLLVKPLREKMVVTVTGIIGDRFGRGAQVIAGIITAFTFPMWSVATAIAFASALHAFTSLSIYSSIIFTAVLLLIFLWSGGMRAVAFTQTMNCIVFVAMVIVGVIAFFINPGFQGLGKLAAEQPQMLDLSSAGVTLIAAWFGTFIVNVLLAQAAFQMTMSCRTPSEGRKGLLMAAGFGLPLIIVGVILGTAAAIVVPHQGLALVAVPLYIAQVLPAPLAGVFFLGIWACALGWAGPCQFSGATSLGRDVGRALRPRATEQDLIRYTRWSLVLLTVLMIVFAFLRAEQSAWWNVLAWTLRNGATLAPVLAAFFWPLATRRAAHAAMITGFASGLLWYQLGGWSPNSFHWGIHPVWVGMSVNVIVLITVSLASTRFKITDIAPRRARGYGAATAWLIFTAAAGLNAQWLHASGLAGLAVFITVALGATTAFLLTETVPDGRSKVPTEADTRTTTGVLVRD
ncbi:sodium:solute symporter [Arthrobacter sp.]|uniref:sodium:solute symporter family protein n=1 Tax=Arthrobacter sp. TaxID=1667 RepID=UPI0026DFF927|nr:sodium:solute symporter family protein [Arthrobacter sp.]MDO5753192.1 sodium:solute symporter family protein [Arthrobacter sp.]MDO5754547.1 sodium:solute symporter family protein [Arthrobacter sp.]